MVEGRKDRPIVEQGFDSAGLLRAETPCPITALEGLLPEHDT
jgi:hypothetical protein